MPTTSYWLAGARPDTEPAASSRFPAVADAEAPVRGVVDVVIVGGGVTGCSCALALAERGVRVRLLEAGDIAGGASGRNGGFALRGAAPSYDQARLELGAAAAASLWELSERALDRIELLAGDTFRRVGSVRLAVDRDELEALAREYEALREDGFAAQWLESMPPVLAARFAGGFVHPGDGAVEPVGWVRRLARRAAAAGAEIVERHPVDPSTLDRLGARSVVLAVDGTTSAFLPELAARVVPMRGQALVTEPLPERLYERPYYARGGYDYWQQLADGRLLVGGRRDTSLDTEQTDVDEVTPAIQAQLDALACELVGSAPPIAMRWSGFWGESSDRLPIAGPVPGRPGLWVASGYSGHGNVLGFACGELIARAICGDRPPELTMLDPGRLLTGHEAR